jgi:hypothetical protein
MPLFTPLFRALFDGNGAIYNRVISFIVKSPPSFWAWFPNEGKIWLIIEVEKSHKGLT